MSVFFSKVDRQIRNQLQWLDWLPFYVGGASMPGSWINDFTLETFTVATALDAQIILN